MSNKPEPAGSFQAKRNEKGQFVPGQSGNPKGRPAGSKNFATLWEEFVRKVAVMKNIDPGEIDDALLAVALERAQKGDYSFFRDIMDRRFGKPTQDVTTNGESIQQTPLALIQALNKKD